MPIKPEQREALERIQTMAIDHAIEELEQAHGLSLGDKDERGDRFFLTKMGEKSLGVACKVENYISLKERDGRWQTNPEQEDAQIERMVKQARGEVEAIIKRAKDGKANAPR